MSRLKRFIPVVAVLSIGILLSLGAFWWTSELERERAQLRFRQSANDRILAIEKGIERNLDVIESLGAFFAASRSVTRESFKVFVKSFHADAAGIQALEWIPRVRRAERGTRERAAREGRFPGFNITERDDRGNLIKARVREEYFPVYFVEPYQGNEAALGFDLASSPTRARALREAADTGRMTATARITLVQEAQDRYGYLVFLPVYRKGAAVDTAEKRRRNLRGFVLGVFRIGEQMEKLLAPLSPAGIDIYLFDDSAPEGKRFLYRHASGKSRETGNAAPRDRRALEAGRHYSRTLETAGRKWTVLCVPAEDVPGNYRSWIPWAAMGALLALTALLGVLLASILRRAQKVETLVKSRTEMLTQAGARLRAIVDTAVDGIITIDDKGRVESFNPAARSLFGYAEEEVLGKNISMLMPEPYRKEHDGYMRNYLSTGVKKIIGIGREVTGRRKNGETFPMELAVSEWFLGERRMFTGITRDITQRKRAESQILESVKIKSDFVSLVSHELRTPLTAIAEGVNLVYEGKIGGVNEEQMECLGISKRNIDRLSRLINDVLDLQKLESGVLPFRFKTCDLNALIREIQSGFSRQAKLKGLEIALVLDERLGAVECDPDRILQVVANFVSNAIKAGENGRIVIKTERKDALAKVSVRDLGQGIDPKDLSKLFNPFSQVNAATGGKPGGTGLGLAICRQIIERHGGAVGVESTPGKGSTFYFTFPVSSS